jgi:hypothetical protein
MTIAMTVAKSLVAFAGTNNIVLAHLDEENVPSAENPGAQLLGGSSPAPSPTPSADRQRVPSAGSPTAPEASAPAPPANAAGVAGPGATIAGAAGSADEAAGNPAIVQGAQRLSVERNTTVGGVVADTGPPPALDLGEAQTTPDLATASLADEIKQADTPSRAAALRVTEQAREKLGAGQLDDALRDLGRAVSIDPGNPFEYFYLGRAYIARHNYQQALTFFKRAEIGFRARPDWLGETVGFEGVCYEELGRPTDGALAYKRALESAPNNLMARVGYSRLYDDLPPPAIAVASTAPAPAAASAALPPPERTAAEPAPAEAAPQPPPPPAFDSGTDQTPVADDDKSQ